MSATPQAVREPLAGVVASFVTLAHCLSFSALLFAGELAGGLPAALWGFMVASAVVTLLSGATTTLPPMLAGPRNPAVAVMSVLAGTIAAGAHAKGLDGAQAAHHVLVALAVASLLTGLCVWALGAFRLGQIVRFVPYPVIAGFLAASGWLLIVGGVRVAGGHDLGLGVGAVPFTGADGLRLAAAGVFVAALLALRRWEGGAGALPVVIIAAAGGLDLVLWLTGAPTGWYLAAGGGAQGWSPLASLGGIDWGIIGLAGVEIVSIAAVSMAALLLDISSLEVQRRTSADMDAEFRSNGAANLAVVAIGGLSVGHALNPSRLIDVLGAKGRAAGLAGGLFVGLVLASGVDLASVVPRPVLGGLLVFLGLGVVGEALKSPGRRSWLEFALMLAIMAAIVRLGYLTGIVLGIVGACLLFAVNYSRIGVVRRHVTRSVYAAPVERAPEMQQMLTREGGRIHVPWLSGFVFFGSSNRLYEEIRAAVGVGAAERVAGGAGGRRWVVLDCSGVTGIDASAVLSFQKLANWAAAADVVPVFAAASSALRGELSGAGLLGGPGCGRHFATRNEALEWCENDLIAEAGAAAGVPHHEPAAFEGWLAGELGLDAARRLAGGYLERRALAAGEVVCALGAPSDTIELVAAGSVAVLVPGLGSEVIRVRRMTGRTVVGEMGFFRGQPRAASVMAEEPAVVYVMTRAAYARLLADAPGLAAAFLEFVVRALSDRVEAANREITALL